MKFFLKNWSVVAPDVWGQEGLGKLPKTGEFAEIKFQLDFVKPAQRRRLSHVTKLALQAASLVAPVETLKTLPTIFVTRHGELANTVKVLKELQQDEIPSPTQFIHSVHGTAAGAFSILLGNKKPSITLSNQGEELTPALFEVAAILNQGESKEVLVVIFDAPVSGQYADYVSEPSFPYAVALHFHQSQGEAFELTESPTKATAQPLAQSLSFVSWLQQETGSFPLSKQGGWQLQRLPEKFDKKKQL